VLIDRDTDSPSLIGVFSGLQVRDIALEQEFFLFSVLTNGRGSVRLELAAADLKDAKEVYRKERHFEFPDPLAVLNFIALVRIVFPRFGWYEFVLLANGEPIAQRKIRIHEKPQKN
jgi:hypothetical protein